MAETGTNLLRTETADKLRGQWLTEDESLKLVGWADITVLGMEMKRVGLLHCVGCDLWTDAPFFDADHICEGCREDE